MHVDCCLIPESPFYLEEKGEHKRGKELLIQIAKIAKYLVDSNEKKVEVAHGPVRPLGNEIIGTNLAVCGAPIVKQFWKAGVYNEEIISKPKTQWYVLTSEFARGG
ncbi:hypothetical protein Tco_0098239 [Tanacetum coccineum]